MSRLLTTGILQQVINQSAGGSFLLDTYPNAAAAYSLRQLKSGITNVVRVRRSSDDAEQDFTPTQITDGTLTAWTGVSNFSVVTFYDESGNTGRDNTESDPLKQFTLGLSGVLNTLNTKPVIVGSSVSAYNSYNISPFKHDTGFTMVFVGKTDLASRNRVVAVGPSNYLLQLDTNGTLDIRNGVGASGSNGGVGSNQAIFQVYIRETAGVLIRANKEAAAVDRTPEVFTDDSMNSLLNALSEMQMQEIICWSTNLESQKDELTDAINAYYNIY